MALDLQNKIKITMGNAVAWVNVVSRYKHLGTVAVDSPAMGCEVTTKCATLTETARPLAKRVFKNIALPCRLQTAVRISTH